MVWSFYYNEKSCILSASNVGLLLDEKNMARVNTEIFFHLMKSIVPNKHVPSVWNDRWSCIHDVGDLVTENLEECCWDTLFFLKYNYFLFFVLCMTKQPGRKWTHWLFCLWIFIMHKTVSIKEKRLSQEYELILFQFISY